MVYNPKIYTVESVTSGHPDKICDRISDSILDECLLQDQKSRVAVEVAAGHGFMAIIGEVTTGAKFTASAIAADVYEEIGYTDSLTVHDKLVKQSPDIAMGVDTGGAGDQGIMYGYATNETAQMLPLGVVLVHQLTRNLEQLRKSKKLSWLLPDGKAQITISEGKVTTVLVSTQHKKDISNGDIRKQLIKHLIMPVVGNYAADDIIILTNPTGNFVTGGLHADSGLTGRKIMVDTYGGLIPHGGGAFSGKDPTKVDRSAAYFCRYVAKNLVARGVAKEALLSVSYAIGKAEPLMVEAVNEKGVSLRKEVMKEFDFRPRAIIERLGLLRPLYAKTAAYGHFTDSSFPWEQIDGN